MRVFLKTSFFILLINGCFNPIFSFQKINHNTQIDSKNPNIIFYKDFLIANKNNSKIKDFALKEIPDSSFEKLKNSVKKNKDPFGDKNLSNETSSFEDLYIVLVGLFKINDENTAMFATKEGIKNYIVGDKIEGFYVIKDIDLLSKEVLITKGDEQKFYKFPE